MGALLHAEFHEVGASGRHWDRASITAAPAGAADESADLIVPSAMKGVEPAPDLVHLTSDTTDHNGTRAHRSSLWRLTPNGRLLYFHQATPYGGRAPGPSRRGGFPAGLGGSGLRVLFGAGSAAGLRGAVSGRSWRGGLPAGFRGAVLGGLRAVLAWWSSGWSSRGGLRARFVRRGPRTVLAG
ncbi:hypothetical protein ABZ307_34090 [Streptomyces griseorubiginosus]|uniref:hypothetical protein n=1 Tax=Streptomyces griseorubiginosus TaxID=67304 RepID=UPI00339E493E